MTVVGFQGLELYEWLEYIKYAHTVEIIDVEGAKKLIATGESKPDANLPAPELAAQTSLALLLLNLDETLTKE